MVNKKLHPGHLENFSLKNRRFFHFEPSKALATSPPANHVHFSVWGLINPRHCSPSGMFSWSPAQLVGVLFSPFHALLKALLVARTLACWLHSLLPPRHDPGKNSNASTGNILICVLSYNNSDSVKSAQGFAN